MIRDILTENLKSGRGGIYSVCSSHPLVLEAAVDQAVEDGTLLVVEATANQVNQFGGYTGMRPADFRDFVFQIASSRGLSRNRIVLGGDHLGPVCWTGEPAEQAMAKAADLVGLYASAGFGKIHLDCSMALPGDPVQLDDTIVAARAAELCAVAEASAKAAFGESGIVYVIGTEVPPPGGAQEDLSELSATPRASVLQTLDVHRKAFSDAGLDGVWDRVLAIVVQPGVEFDNEAVVDYRPELAVHLRDLAETDGGGLVFEAHSTDYQTEGALVALVRDHFAILKVGPAVTFALREALFALAHIEDEICDSGSSSNLRGICEQRMLANPGNWERFYPGSAQDQRLQRHYSLSDRIRYYWPDPEIEVAVSRLLQNLADRSIPVGLLRQYLPELAPMVRLGQIEPDPKNLIKAKIRGVLRGYALACAGVSG